ncbi:tetratricopeptide repeat protein [Schaalia suimastitidis]|uniref:tetratricopeptide repeat protein n=1 Tax=Schaalia suimastitidis TaxID=121163 RepID=UPI000424C61E|nr:hypothetical protein [Schaalia suimastitidis]
MSTTTRKRRRTNRTAGAQRVETNRPHRHGAPLLHIDGYDRREIRLAERAALSGDYDTAITTLEAVIAAEDLPTRLKVHLLKTLVDWCAQDERWAEAGRHASRGAALACAELEENDELTFVARNADLYWKCINGYALAAKREYPRLIADVTAALGADHPLTHAARNNSAMPYKYCSDFKEAANIYRDLAQDMRDQVGPRDIFLHTVYMNLAETLALAGQIADSNKVYEDLLADLLDYRQPDDEMVLSIRHEIAGNVFAQGNIDEALQLWALLRKDCQQHLGNHHPLTMQQHGVYLSVQLAEENWSEAKNTCELILNAPKSAASPGWFDEIETLAAVVAHFEAEPDLLQ